MTFRPVQSSGGEEKRNISVCTDISIFTPSRHKAYHVSADMRCICLDVRYRLHNQMCDIDCTISSQFFSDQSGVRIFWDCRFRSLVHADDLRDVLSYRTAI